MDLNQKIRYANVCGRLMTSKFRTVLHIEDESIALTSGYKWAYIPQDMDTSDGTVNSSPEKVRFIERFTGQVPDWGTALYIVNGKSGKIVGGYYLQNWDSAG